MKHIKKHLNKPLNRYFFNKKRYKIYILPAALVFILLFVYGCMEPSVINSVDNGSGSLNSGSTEGTSVSEIQSSDISFADMESGKDLRSGEGAASEETYGQETGSDASSGTNKGENNTNNAEASDSEGQQIEVVPMAPQIQLQVILGPEYAQDNQVCFYRVAAHVAGEPFPQIKFNRDDSNGAWGPNIAQVNLSEDQSFTLICEASNTQGIANSSLTVSWVENANPDQENQAEADARAQQEIFVDYGNPAGFFIDVNLTEQKVTVSYNDTVLKRITCSGGTPQTPTPTGMFQTSQKIYYAYIPKFAQAAYYWTRFYGPYLFHSVPYDINGNLLGEEFAKMGTPASHGCIRLYLEDAKWMYETLPPGINVSIHY